MIDEKKLIEQLRGYKEEWKLAEPFHEGIASGLQIAIEATERQPKVGEWIPVSERLPEPNNPVLICENDGGIHLCRYSKFSNRFFYDGSDWDIKLSEVKAWMPLPEPYKEGD